MAVKVHKHTTYQVCADDRTFDVTFKPENDPEVYKLLNGMTIVAYLTQQDDCTHPLDDCDGMGHILRSRDAQDECRAALKDPLSVLLDCYEHGGVAWSVAGEGMQCQWDTSHNAGVWEPDDCCTNHIRYMALISLLPEGTRVAYERHKSILNSITYTLPDGGKKHGYKSFAAAAKAAAKALGVKPDKAAVASAERAMAVECARTAVELYTDWCNGECYGAIVDVFDADGKVVTKQAGMLMFAAGDDRWDIVGYRRAEKELAEAVDATIKTLNTQKVK